MNAVPQRRADRVSRVVALPMLIFLALPHSAHAQGPVLFRDVVRDSGITFRHSDGSSGRRYVIESMTGGVALFDSDGDGKLDIYFLNGAPLQGTQVDVLPTNALYRNQGNWRFVDVTQQAGVGDSGYGLGVAVADFDNDGHPDIYVNNFGPNVLYRNNGDGTFSDVTQACDVANGDRVGAGACFLDLDADGDLDLYAGNYLQFSYEKHKPHTFMGLPSYPSPLNYSSDPDTVYRNNGDSTFSDVSVESRVALRAGNCMGVACSDYDDDGDTDLFVANDVQANFLFRNDGAGTFDEVALLAGTAYDVSGIPHGNMGVDAGDFDNDGLPDFYVTSFSGELAVLYRNLGNGFFEDATRLTNAGEGTLPHVTWGTGFADFDNDGHRDLFVACGHLDDNVELRDDTTAHAVPNLLLMNDGRGKFSNVSQQSGDGMAVRLSSRGMALGDLDNDGDIDVVVLNSRREPTLLRNETPPSNHWITLRLQGLNTNRNGIGARVKVAAGDLVQVDEVRSGRGYQSHFDMRLHFGLGKRNHVDRIEVRWLGGGVSVVEHLEVDQIVTVTESRSPK